MTWQATGMVPLLQVFDMPRSLQFYCERLGFEVQQRSPEVETPEGRFSHWCWLRKGQVTLMLNTAYDSGERPAERDDARWAGHADLTLYIECAEVDAVRAEMAIAEPATDTLHGSRELSLVDPDGYRIVLTSPAH